MLKYLLLSTAIISKPLQIDYRLHTNISRYPWAKLWYALRALDEQACGYYEFPLALGELVTGRDEKTIYRWLKEGKRWGAFRFYKTDRRRQVIKVGLGGLEKVCIKLNLRDWGEVAPVSLLEINRLRPLTTQVETQSLQQRSRYAANRQIKKQQRPLYAAPAPNELVPKNQPSLKSAGGKLDFLFVLFRSQTRVFVSKGFCCYGISQEAISRKVGVCKRTIQRHHNSLNLQSRQICQKKGAYGWITRAWEHETQEYSAEHHPDSTNTRIGYKVIGQEVHFFDGSCAGSQKVNEFNVPCDDFEKRFFKMGNNWWMNKCNVYREELSLTTMRGARRHFKCKLAKMASENCHSDTSKKIEPLPIRTIK